MPWGNIASAALGAGLSYLGGREARSAQSQWMDRANQFTEKTLKNAYQWRVQDLKAAGINPMLAISQGVDTGRGAMATASDYVTPAVSTAMQGRRLREDIKQMTALRRNIEQEYLNLKEVNQRTVKEMWLRDYQGRQAEAQSDITRMVRDWYKHNPWAIELKGFTDATQGSLAGSVAAGANALRNLGGPLSKQGVEKALRQLRR